MMGILGFKNPAKKAEPYLNQIAPMAKEQYNPYIQRGQEAGNQAYGQYQQMTANPGNFINDLLTGYTPSRGFDFKKQQAEQAMRNSAAAGGYAGTTADQTRQGELASSLASQDMYEWLDRVLGQHGQGLQGLGNLQQQGFSGTNDLVNILGSTLGKKCELAYQGQINQNSNISDILKLLPNLLGNTYANLFDRNQNQSPSTPPFFPGNGGYRQGGFAGMNSSRSDQGQSYNLPQSGMYPTNIW